jgi:predicted ATPase
MAAETPEKAYAGMEALARRLDRASAVEAPVLLHLALRAALHPVLRAYRDDPLLTIDGEFISLDARVAALAEMALAQAGQPALRFLSAGDREALGGQYTPESVVVKHSPGPGEIFGALYVPGLNRGVVCAVRAAPASRAGEMAAWAPPVAVRPVSPSIERSAARALVQALTMLCEADEAPPGLAPGLLFYDVCCPELSDSQMESVSGESLELPLALAFLSALLGRSFDAGVGATGALGDCDAGDAPVRAVGNVAEKAAAFRSFTDAKGFYPSIFLAPKTGAEPSEVVAVSSLGEAAVLLLPAFGAAPAKADDPVGGPTVTVAVCFSEGNPARRGSDVDGDRLVLATLRRRGGRLRAARDDGRVMAAEFADVASATDAARAVRRVFRCYPWSNEHGAPGIPGFGVDVASENPAVKACQAQSLAEAALPGDILLTARARDLVTEGAFAIALETLGLKRLFDLRPPVGVWRLAGQGTANTPRIPLRGLDDRPHNLPVLMTPTIGRDIEIAMLHRLLLAVADRARVVSITGPGGIGKSRLGLAVAAAAGGAFPEGVWVVPVRGCRSPDDVAAAIAERLGILTDPRTGSVAGVCAKLQGQRTLLLLDGCEEGDAVSAVARFVLQIPAACADLSVLTTTRTPLGIPGETVFPIGPLALTPNGDAMVAPAEALFLACARDADPDFTPDATAIQAICRHTGGLPLAIELTAATVSMLSLPEIVSRLHTQPASGDRPASLQRTIADAIALLPADARDLLADLSVFDEGFTPPAARSLRGDNENVLHTIALLQGRALVSRPAAGNGRYQLLSAVQEFAAGMLKSSDRAVAVGEAHARYFAGLAAALGRAERDSSREAEGFDRLQCELGNLRKAFEWLRAHEPERLPPFIADMANFLRYRGHFREWRDWPRVALRNARSAPCELRARLLLYQAAAYFDSSEIDEALPFAIDARELALSCGPIGRASAAAAANLIGLCFLRQGSRDTAKASFGQARDLYAEVGDPNGEVAALNNLGLVTDIEGDPAGSEAHYRAAASLARLSDDRRGLAVAIANLGVLALDRGDLSGSRRLFEEFLTASRALRDTTRIAHALVNLGDVVNRQGEWEFGTPMLALSRALFLLLRHPGLAEADRCLAEAEDAYGADRIAALTREFEAHRLSDLLQIDPGRYAPLSLTVDRPANEIDCLKGTGVSAEFAMLY